MNTTMFFETIAIILGIIKIFKEREVIFQILKLIQNSLQWLFVLQLKKLIKIKPIKVFDVFFKYYFIALPFILAAIGFLGFKVHSNPLTATFFLIISVLGAWIIYNLNKKQIQQQLAI